MEKTTKKLRILFNSNAIWSISGYGQQVSELLPKLRDAGYPVGLIAFYGLEGGIIDYNGITVYPRINHVYGSDAMRMHAEDFKADVVFSLQDIWVLDPNDLKAVKRWIPIVPVDHEPIPQAVYDRLKMAYRVVTYSKFGHEELMKQGMHSTYIPHTVDTSVYKPKHQKLVLKKQMGIPQDHFLFGMVAANKDNPPRKSFQEAIDAFKMFNDKHPKSSLYLHTYVDQPGGFPITQYATALGLRDKIFFPETYKMTYRCDKETMSNVYNTLDCLLAPSTSEGFCVPLIEAQACGVPVITNTFTAMKEMVLPNKTGFLVDVAYKRFSAIGSFIGIPDVKSIYEAMEKVYKADRLQMGKDAALHIQANYDTNKVVAEKWLPYLELLEQEIYGKVDNNPAK